MRLATLEDSTVKLHIGDCRDVLPALSADAAQCCITSPPYWGHRKYGVSGEIGQEQTSELYLEALTNVFRKVKRVLHPQGILWLVIGDKYLNKQLLGLPWRLALALQADGWVLRSDIIWKKPNGLPESVRDRAIVSHEYIFMLTKSRQYQFFPEAWEQPVKESSIAAEKYARLSSKRDAYNQQNVTTKRISRTHARGRSVWEVPVSGNRLPHTATMPKELISRCLRASCCSGNIVLDPFAGTGSVAAVAEPLGLVSWLIDADPRSANWLQQLAPQRHFLF